MTSQTARILAFLLVLPLGCGAERKREPAAPSDSAPAGMPAMEQAPPPAAEPSAPTPAPAEGEKDALEESRLSRDDLATAEADLEAARRELEIALGPLPAKPSATSGSGAAGPPAAAPATRARPTEAADEAPKAKADKKTAESSCQTACRAFQSLGRAAGSICRLAGEKDERCGHARGVVSQAERRVTSCACKTE